MLKYPKKIVLLFFGVLLVTINPVSAKPSSELDKPIDPTQHTGWITQPIMADGYMHTLSIKILSGPTQPLCSVLTDKKHGHRYFGYFNKNPGHEEKRKPDLFVVWGVSFYVLGMTAGNETATTVFPQWRLRSGTPENWEEWKNKCAPTK
ncbi:MAG: hypothetical protein AAGA35_03330 [Patescibacteria group bacterium]